MLQIISQTGEYDKEREPNLSTDDLKQLHFYMVLARVFDSKMMALQRQGRMGFCMTEAGQEAAVVGSAYAMAPQDWLFPSYREPAAALVRGLPLKTAIAQYLVTSDDLLKGRQMPMHCGARNINFVINSSTVATQIPHSVGVAMASKITGDNVVTLAYFGDGATSASDFHVSMNFAGVFKAPTIFFCQNNGWAVSMKVSEQTASESIFIKAQAYGFEGILVDGCDVLAVYDVVRRAAEKARSGGGPTLIEAVNYRWDSHSSADDANRYRDLKELEEWRSKDPISRYERYLLKKNIFNKSEVETVWQDTEESVNKAVKEAEKAPPPPIESIFDDVFDEIPPFLQEQKKMLMEELKRRRVS